MAERQPLIKFYKQPDLSAVTRPAEPDAEDILARRRAEGGRRSGRTCSLCTSLSDEGRRLIVLARAERPPVAWTEIAEILLREYDFTISGSSVGNHYRLHVQPAAV